MARREPRAIIVMRNCTRASFDDSARNGRKSNNSILIGLIPALSVEGAAILSGLSKTYEPTTVGELPGHRSDIASNWHLMDLRGRERERERGGGREIRLSSVVDLIRSSRRLDPEKSTSSSRIFHSACLKRHAIVVNKKRGKKGEERGGGICFFGNLFFRKFVSSGETSSSLLLTRFRD